MQREALREKLFSRRALLLAGIEGSLVLVLAGRMYQLQVVESAAYRLLAKENSVSLRLLAPPRGRVLDRFGAPLADNRPNYRAVIVAEEARNIPATLDAFARVIALDPAERGAVLREVRRVHAFVPVVVRSNLHWDEMARVEVASPELPGISIEQGLTRHYPLGPGAAHVLGYVGAVSQKEQDGDPLLELPDFRIGKSGIEKSADGGLRGTAGHENVEVNAYGRVVRELSREPPRPGRDVVTTLDRELQEFAFRRASEEPSVATVTLDALTGEVLALASVPSFDPAAFAAGLTPAMWQELSTDPRNPLSDKVIAGAYPPGSTFKLTVATAALEAGVLTPQTEFTCPGFYRLGNAVFHCWKHGGHGTLALHDAIKQSCDVYFYNTARRLGIEKLAAMARRFGYGAKLGIDIAGERPGLIPDHEWKKQATHRPWEAGETLITGIGQGFVLVTPLQIATMVARLVTGRQVVPRLFRESGGAAAAEPPPQFADLGVDPRLRAVILEAMVAVVNEPRGTGYELRIKEPGMSMGGKSGTSQVHRITEYEREHSALT
ncbi:MAG TPA: penicillin-binding protein 2, partial [Stellaceae bacterium]|nr:penicillin-binding protein 2 [Stellaceae bacterium]